MSKPHTNEQIQKCTITLKVLLEKGFLIPCDTNSTSPHIDLTVLEPTKTPSE